MIGIALAVPLLGERLSWFHLAGAALVGSSILWSYRSSREEASAEMAEAQTGYDLKGRR